MARINGAVTEPTRLLIEVVKQIRRGQFWICGTVKLNSADFQGGFDIDDAEAVNAVWRGRCGGIIGRQLWIASNTRCNRR